MTAGAPVAAGPAGVGPKGIVAGALIASAAVGVGAAFGGAIVIGAAMLGIAVAVCARSLVRQGRETVLLLLAGSILFPVPQPLRTGMLVAVIALVVGVAVADRVWPTADARPLDRQEAWMLSGVLAFYLCLCAASIWSGHSGPLTSFVVAAIISLAFMWALYRRVQAVGPTFLAVGIAGAAVVASLLVLLRVGGVPLIGAAGSVTYVDAKGVAVGKLGDVNGQALVVMLGLPFLLAFALQLRTRVALTASIVGVLLSALALLVLLSRSSLIGAVAGAAVVTVVMSRMSRRRALLVGAAAAAAAVYFASGVEQLSADNTNLMNRSVLWRTAIDFWHQRPLLGHGPDSWPRLVAEQVRWAPPKGDGATHNIVLAALVSGGLLAAGLAVALVVTVVLLGVRNLRRLRSSGDPVRCAAVAGAMGAFSAQVVRGGFEATGWPGTRTNDLRTWAGLLLMAIVVVLTARVRGASEDPAARAASAR